MFEVSDCGGGDAGGARGDNDVGVGEVEEGGESEAEAGRAAGYEHGLVGEVGEVLICYGGRMGGEEL